ncbi:enoyl-ACP reductase FabI [bacterium]|nr:enoyl-ACP reductase FabI [bacterium]
MGLAQLHGKHGIIIGIANDHSIAYGCASVARAQGATLALSYMNDKARPHVEPLARGLGADIFLPCDVTQDGQMEALVAAAAGAWGHIDFVIHSIAFAPKDDLHGRVTDCSREGFLKAMDISCHSFIRLAKLVEPWMQPSSDSNGGGSILTVSYYGAEKVVAHYNMMGPVKAALEASTRYLAAELGPKNIRVNAISPGPVPTRAASGIEDFDSLVAVARQKSPLKRIVTPEEVGKFAAFLASDDASGITGGVHYVDAGYGIID